MPKNVIIIVTDVPEKKSPRQLVAYLVERVRDALLETFKLDSRDS